LEVTATLARFVAESRWEDVPPQVRHEGKRTLLNSLGAALGGCRDDAVSHALAVLGAFSGAPQVTVLGRGERLDMLSAAFVNGASANVFDFDDTHLPTVIHPAAPVVPAVLALAEHSPITGPQMLHALILGVEIECRVGNAITPWHYAHGWHITSTCGVIGAAAAAARLLRLDAQHTAAAIGLGANQACGLIESLGTMAKSVSVGNAPRNGLLAALLAQRGFSASPRTLEGPRGFLHVMGERPDVASITHGLGRDWESTRNTYKPYPCGVVLHPVIDALLHLRRSAEIHPESVRKVIVKGNPLLRERTDRRNPSTGREAQVSVQHTAAVCLAYGAAGIREYSDRCVAEPVLQAFADKVQFEDDPGTPVESAAVELHLEDGRKLSAAVPHALGSLGNAMSDAQIEAKVRDLAAFGAPACEVESLIAQVWNLESLDDAAGIARLAAG